MRKFVIAAALAALVLTVSASAGGTPKLSTFGTGDVFVNGAKGATFNDSGEYGGWYRAKPSRDPLSKVHVSFVNQRAVGGGAPRFSIPIDENNDHNADAYAFLDVNGCGSSTVSTDSANCTVYYKSETQTNWAAFVAAHPTWKLASRDGGKTEPFVIADVPGDYLVTDIALNY